MTEQFKSSELLNAEVVPQFGQLAPTNLDVEKIKGDIRSFLLTKGGSDYLQKFELGSHKKSGSTSGLSTLRDYLNIVREQLCIKYKDDNTKDFAIRKLFDNIFNSLDCLGLLGLDYDNNQVNSLILGYIIRNLI